MTRRPVPFGRMLRVAGVLLVLGAFPPAPVDAQEGEEFGGYELVATGSGFTVAPSVPAVLPVETPVEGTLALALASLSTGGLGYGQASSAYPGTPIVGIRPLLEIGAGVALPIPDYPLIVESREHEDPKTSRVPGVTMSSSVKPAVAVVTSDLGGFTLPGLMDVGSVRTVSTSVVEPGLGGATSESEVNGVDVLGGVLQIDTIESVASAETDSTASTCDGSTTVSGATVNGTPVTIDQDGIHSDGEAVVPGVDPNEALLDVLESSGVEARVLGGTESCDGPSAIRTTSGLLVSVPLPAVGAIPPGGSLDVIFGATSAQVTARPAFEFVPPEVPDDLPTIRDAAPRVPGPSSGGSLEPAEVVSEAPPSTVAPLPRVAELGELGEPEAIDYSFGGVPASLVAGLMLLAVPGSRRIRRYLDRVMSMAGT